MAQNEFQRAEDLTLLQSTGRCQQEPFFNQQGQVYYLPTHLFLENSLRQLSRPRKCYVCRLAYTRLHHHYHRLCPVCAELNFQRRSFSVDLTGRIALVTGGRIKIGFETALKLLRAGAQVHITSRFKFDALRRYQAEIDYQDWSSRLVIHELDLRHLASVQLFCDHLSQRLKCLDILINNAAQTIKKPSGYFVQMAQKEAALQRYYGPLPALGFGDVRWQQQQQQLCGLNLGMQVLRDEFDEPVDLQTKNSWQLRLHECSVEEMLEVQLVNVTAPFILNSSLKHLFGKSAQANTYIVNVSAMEGQFNRPNKTMRHPHTNMAKAALNMMTRTAAMDYARDRIFMTSVDTGWITEEHPFHQRRLQRLHGKVPPLDSIDGAARVLAPVFDAEAGGVPDFGVFLKDYQVTEW